MQIKTEQKIKPVTHIEALAALWCVKLRLGQYPIHTLWMEAGQLTVLERWQKRI